MLTELWGHDIIISVRARQMLKLIDSRTKEQILSDKIQACANVVSVQARHPEWAKFNNVEIAVRYALLACKYSKQV